MSIQAVAWVLDHSGSRLVARLVLITLANYANDDLLAWPAQRTIAEKAGISKSAVGPAIRDLVRLGELEVVDPGDQRRSARYRLIQRPPDGHSSAHHVDSAPAPGVDSAPAPRGGQIHQEPSGTVSEAPQSEPITATAPTPEQIARTAELAAQARQALRERRPEVLRGDSADGDPEAVTGDLRPPDAAERALPPSDR